MARNPENAGIVNHRLISLVDSDNVFIKNLIIRNIYKENAITEATRDYILLRCEKNASFVVRKVCKEVKRNQLQSSSSSIKDEIGQTNHSA